MPSNSENHVSTAGNMRNISCPRKEQTTYNDAGEAIRIAEHHCPKICTRQRTMAQENCTTCAPSAHNFANRAPTVWAHCTQCCAHRMCTHMVLVSLATVSVRAFNGQVLSLFSSFLGLPPPRTEPGPRGQGRRHELRPIAAPLGTRRVRSGKDVAMRSPGQARVLARGSISEESGQTGSAAHVR